MHWIGALLYVGMFSYWFIYCGLVTSYGVGNLGQDRLK